MSEEAKLAISQVIVYTVVGLLITSVLLWVLHLRPLLRRLGGKPAFWLFNWAMLVDYARLKRLMREAKINDPIIKVFEVCYGAAGVLVFAMVLWVILDRLID